MSISALNWAFELRGVSVSQKVVLISLANFADENGFAFPSIKTIADMSCISDSSVRRALAELVEAGILRIDYRFRADGSQTSSGYFLGVTPPVNLTPPPPTVTPPPVTADTPYNHQITTTNKDIQAPPTVTHFEVDDIWKHATPEGRKRSTKDEVATAYSKAIKKLNHGEIIAGVRAYYEDCTKTGCGHMAPHRLLWDSRAKKPGRVINYVPKQKTDKVSLDDLRAWVRMRDLSHVFVWPESKAGMDEQTARQLLEAS